MSSGAKRLVQSLRGRNGGGSGAGNGGSNRGSSTRSDSHGDCVGGAAASTSATRLFHYDSGHELDEISVIARGADDITTPTTPYHHYGAPQVAISTGPAAGQLRYGSGQTLYSIAGSVPPAPAAPLTRITPTGEFIIILHSLFVILSNAILYRMMFDFIRCAVLIERTVFAWKISEGNVKGSASVITL